MEAIPFTPRIPNERLEVVLAGVPIVIVSRWNADEDDGKGAFYLDISEIDGTLIEASIKVVLGTFLGRRSTHPFFLSRGLLACDTSNTGIECGVDDLGARVQVLYLTEVDLHLATAPAIP